VCNIKAIFLDRDGTINKEKNYVHRIDDFELIPGALEALKLLTSHNISIYIVTNQAGIAKGYFTEEQFKELTKYMVDWFKDEGISIEDVLFCPHHPEGIIPDYTMSCRCRKPGTMLIENIMKLNGISTNETVLVGDKNTDIDAGVNLGMTTYLVRTGYGESHQADTRATYVMPDILSVVKHLIQDVRK